jgi:hypothetical protein
MIIKDFDQNRMSFSAMLFHVLDFLERPTLPEMDQNPCHDVPKDRLKPILFSTREGISSRIALFLMEAPKVLKNG